MLVRISFQYSLMTYQRLRDLKATVLNSILCARRGNARSYTWVYTDKSMRQHSPPLAHKAVCLTVPMNMLPSL